MRLILDYLFHYSEELYCCDEFVQGEVGYGFQRVRYCSLACFVTDDADESATWENTYFTDEEVAPLVGPLLAQCVLVRLQAGSVDAGFLAAFCPIQDVPYFTVIKHGALVANIKAGDSREEFVRLLKGAFTEPQDAPPAAATEVQSPASPALAPAPTTPPRVPVASSGVPGRTENSSFLQQQKKRQQEASEERQRVLQLLENDKKEREARRRKKVVEDKAPSASTTEPSERGTPKSHSSSETAISFRMLDGLSLKAKFPSSAILATDVRKFVDQHRTDSDHPYNFLQILAPLPNKQITISEENSTLSELGLSPTCTLVLVPTSSSPASAYSGGGGSTEAGGIFSRIYGFLYSIVTTLLGVGYYPLVPAPMNAELAQSQSLPTASLLSSGDASASSSSGQASSREEVAGTRIRTLYDGRGNDGDADRKYYNGNQVCAVFISSMRGDSRANDWTAGL
ncbi:hypothetical protein B9Z19DRAFT_1061580 [Tuber borchii]|uniref:UBX domain-containing protein n=1 Tax=Tuber borchii TaxID=42251 RepID=A0A2T7A4L1_TUBBO|nr:hypothetical protein B9Z19DRAFT_1061580 [Tuber borchii]